MDIKRQCTDLGLCLSTQDVLSMPTVRQLARLAKQKPPAVRSRPQDRPQLTYTLDQQSLNASIKNKLSILGNNVESITYCSPFQRRMYKGFHSEGRIPYIYNNLVKLERLSVQSHDGLASRPSGQSEISRLLRSWQQTIQRHSILRTTFVGGGSTSAGVGELCQVVLKSITPESAVFHVTSTDDILTRSRAHLETFRRNVFKENLAPHSLAILVDESDSKALYMHLILSHMLVDHVSLAHIMSDFDLFYRGWTVDLMPPCKPFGDYISLSTAPRPEEGGDDSVQIFWQTAFLGILPCILERKHLSGGLFPASDVTPMDKIACITEKSVASVKLTLNITDSVDRLCRDAEVTLSNLLQFVWAVLLHLLTNNDAVCFGYLASDRDRIGDDELEIVGPVLCLLVGRVVFSQGSGTILHALCALQKHNIECMSRASSFDLTSFEKGLSRGGYQRLDTASAPGRQVPPVLFNTLINYRKVKYSSPKDLANTMNYRSIWKQDPHEVRFRHVPASLPYLTKEKTARNCSFFQRERWLEARCRSDLRCRNVQRAIDGDPDVQVFSDPRSTIRNTPGIDGGSQRSSNNSAEGSDVLPLRAAFQWNLST
jgi:fumiquinazoline F synthetase